MTLSSDPTLEVKNLSVLFQKNGSPVKAVDRVSLSIPQGKIVCLVGESGCGKSASALAMMGLISKSQGIVEAEALRFKGKDLSHCSEKEWREIRGKEMAMIFQEPMTSLNPVFTVGEQIAETIRAHESVSSEESRERAIQSMDLVGIGAAKKRYDDYPHQLSGGMRQRVMIAMSLCCNPSLLIADEPTTALDVTIQAQILELILSLQKKMKMSVLLITHDLGVVAEVADQVAIMYAGSIVEMADVRALLQNPSHPYTRALQHSIPQGHRSQNKTGLPSIAGRVPELGSWPPYCRFYDRCQLAEEDCRDDVPQLREFEASHWVRCIKA